MIPALLITTLIPPNSSIIESQKLLTFSLWLKSTVKNLILSLEGSSSRKLDIFSSEDPRRKRLAFVEENALERLDPIPPDAPVIRMFMLSKFFI